MSIGLLLALPRNLWIMLLGTLLINAAYWMTWPFLAILLHNQYHLSTSAIGAMLSLSVVVSTLAGLYLGNVSDKMGRHTMMVVGCVLAVLAYLMLAYANSVMLYLMAMGVVSLSRAILDPMSKAIFGDLVESADHRAAALQLRYCMVNLGAALGPLVGAYAGLAAQQQTFLVASVAYAIYSALLAKIFYAKDALPIHQVKSSLSFWAMLTLLKVDHAFLALVMVNILLWIVFVQFESSIALYFAMLHLPGLVQLLSFIIATNTLTVVVLQFPLLRGLARWSVPHRIYISLAILAISQLAFASVNSTRYLPWIVATMIFSMAEVILVPSLNIQIDQMAPNHLRGSYFAVSFLYRIGFGAYIGGVLLQHGGAKGLFITMFFVTIVSAVLYHLSSKLKRPQWND
jgi:MFS family permease